jgi:hypothetical protein
MNCKWLRSGFLSQYRIEITMWVLVVEMLASPLADTHPRAGALLGLAVLSIVVAGIRYVAAGVEQRVSVQNFLFQDGIAYEKNQRFLNTTKPTLFQQLRDLACCKGGAGVPDGI